MQSGTKIFFLLLCLFISGQAVRVNAQQIIPVNGNWEFRKVGDSSWQKATVPGTVHTDLFNNKKIKDPFYRLNEKDLQWIDKEDWEYRTSIEASAAELSSRKLLLVFEGLDTYADVYVNNSKVLVADNMFRTWKADIKNQLHAGSNDLRIYFHSPTKTGLAFYNSLPFRIPVSDNDQVTPKVSVYTRKAGYHYGWDWGPRFVTSGVWRPVHLEIVNGDRITELFIKQKGLSPKVANLQANLEVESLEAGPRLLQIFADGSATPLYSSPVHVEKGINTLVSSFKLADPQLWWPNGYGAHKLYTFRAMLSAGGKASQTSSATQLPGGSSKAEKSVRQGLRTVEVVQESGARGNSFYFLVNGVKIFMKGSNYIPLDNFLPSVTQARYEHVINTAVLSNMNMLRVWGGGIYENEQFYNLCDEKGIMVWQDFMFACSMEPPFELLKQNIYDEAVENVKRLRTHPSIALYCGNNEDVAFMTSNYWGDGKGAFRNRQDSMTVVNTYKEIFHSILPGVVKAYDDDHFYWSTSPQSTNYSSTSQTTNTTGDVHSWYVWGQGKPIETYRDNIGPFMTEYGFQSFPDVESIKQFTLPEDADINSAVLMSHQRSYVGNGAILSYMKRWYKVPAAFADFLYVGEVLQAEAIKIAVEAHRRAKPFCMGSLYWQIDDCWPAASWSSMDYYGHWKALQYEVKRSFEPVIISPVIIHDSLEVYAVSDKLQPFPAKLQVRLLNFKGQVIRQSTTPITVAANTSTRVYQQGITALLQGADRAAVYLDVRLESATGIIAENTCYFENPKDLKLTKTVLRHTLAHTGQTYTVTITSPELARNVRVSAGNDSIIFSDNYFDLQPGQYKTITFQSDKSLTEGDIKLKTINELN